MAVITEWRTSRTALRRMRKATSCTFLTLVGLGMVFPLLWMVSTSLKREGTTTVYELRLFPRDAYIRLDGRRVRAVEQQRLPGRYMVEARAGSGPAGGWEIDGDELQHRFGFLGTYVRREVDGIARRAPVRVLREIEPPRALVKVVDDDEWAGRTAWVRFDEIELETRLRWANYAKAWNEVGLGRAYLNSLLVAVSVTLGQVLTSALAAYAFSRLRFPGRDKLFFGYLATMMIPAAVTAIPLYILMSLLRWRDTYVGLIVPAMFSAYGTFLLRQFFMGLPRDLDAAAKIDGCGHPRIFWHVVLPLSKPALATLATFTFMGNWRGFMWPLIMVDDYDRLQTIPLALMSFQGFYHTNWVLLMAASTLSLLPIVVVFLVAQRFFVEGIRLGAVKG